MRVWRTDEEKAADERERPYLIAEAWGLGALTLAGFLLAGKALYQWLT